MTRCGAVQAAPSLGAAPLAAQATLRPGDALGAAADICREISPGTGYSLAKGALGIALACQLVGTASSDQEVIDLGRKHLSLAAATWQQESGPDLGLFNGYAGFAWVVAEFATADPRYQESVERLAGRLARAIIDEPPTPPASVAYRQRDVIDGWAGQLACVLRLRHAMVPGPVLRLLDQAGAKLIGLLAFPAANDGDLVSATFVPTPSQGGADWYRRLYPHGHYPLGMAHGAAGVIAVLAAALRDGVNPPGMLTAVTRLASWLARYQGCDTPQSWGGALGADVTGQPIRDIRFRVPSGWCKGTSGVAAALGAAAVSCDQPWLGSIAAEALRSAQARGADLPARDAGLCHGSSGRALIYLRAGLMLGDQELSQEGSHQLAGLVSDRSSWPASDGLLGGRAGLAYALALSATACSAPADAVPGRTADRLAPQPGVSGHRLLLLG